MVARRSNAVLDPLVRGLSLRCLAGRSPNRLGLFPVAGPAGAVLGVPLGHIVSGEGRTASEPNEPGGGAASLGGGGSRVVAQRRRGQRGQYGDEDQGDGGEPAGS
jgi:hypothetical protein